MSKLLSFSKYQGAGNDFILIDNRFLHFNIRKVPQLCHRKKGIGADGVILLQNDEIADFRMRIFNPDGTEAENCGNGLRCFMKFIADLGFARKTYNIAVHHQVLEASYLQNQIKVWMGKEFEVRFFSSADFSIGFDTFSLEVGVPHTVIFVDRLEQFNVLEEGARLRHHPLFLPRGTNVNFAALQSDGSIKVRTFERGVEGETLSCGTGACAVGIIAHQKYQRQGPIPVKFSGGAIEVHIEPQGVYMAGGAEKVFEGRFTTSFL